MRVEPAGNGKIDTDDSPLNGRDAELVQRIEQEGLTTFTFDGIRRITKSHPETLSRSMERLEEQGLVVKSPDGYEITNKARGSITLRPAFLNESRAPLLQTLLPYDVDPLTIIHSLKGRWFDRLRWVGVSEGDSETTLKWVTEDGSSQIDARFSNGSLNIEARVKQGTELSTAVKAAHHMMNRISRLYSVTRPGRRLMYMRLGDSRPSPAAM